MDELRIRARQLRANPSEAERHLWHQLRMRNLHGFKFRRQHPIAGYIADFACIEARLVIELDGGQHADARAYDETRTRRIEAKGYRVLRFWNNDVLSKRETVLEMILRECHARR
jgi:adenine-specific DNA-methyltransferase